MFADYKTAYRDIMFTYESDRNRAERLRKMRRAELYRSVPRLQDIDDTLADLCLHTAKRLLRTDIAGRAALQADGRAQTDRLLHEKAALFREHNIPDDYLTDVYRCALCQDTGFQNAGLQDTGVTTAQQHCACFRQRIIDKYYDLSGIRKAMEKENFDTFNLDYYSKMPGGDGDVSPYDNSRHRFHVAKHFVETFGTQFKNLLLTGDTGLGKTFLCNGIAKALLDRGRTVLYVTAPQYFALVENYRFRREETGGNPALLHAATEADLLILDDLGAEFATSLTGAALFSLLNERLLREKPVVMSTNLTLPDLEGQYSDRVVSRFLGHYTIMKFFGDDIRIKKKYAGGAL